MKKQVLLLLLLFWFSIVSHGQTGSNLNFDGTNDFVTLPVGAGNDLLQTSEFTIEFWFKGTNLQNAVRFRNGENYIVAGSGAGAPQFIVSNDGGTNGVSCGPAATINDNTWHHLACVWKRNTIFATYLDGVLQNSRTAVNEPLPRIGNNLAYLGSAGGTAEFLRGNLDDVRIWLVAKTASEIASSRYCELTGEEPNLLVYYNFNQGIAGGDNRYINFYPTFALLDSGNYVHNGTLTNFAQNGFTSNFVSNPPISNPVAPAASSQGRCPGETVANLIPAPSATIKWYNVANGGTALENTTALISGTYYAVAVSANGCEGARKSITVTVNPIPTAPTAVTPQIFSGSAIIANIAATGTNKKWYTSNTGGTALAASTTLVDGATYFVSQTISSCESSSRTAVVINIISPPTITSFTPLTAKPGAVVTITGTGFNSTVANNIVFFGATRATVTAASATSITITVPVGATYAPITLLNTGTSLATFSRANFTPTYSPSKIIIATSDFLPKQDFTSGSATYSVAIGDLDGDGKPDLAVANQYRNTVSIFRNTATSGSITTESYATKVDFTTGTFPIEVAIGDLDGDGKLDLAVANLGSKTVSIFRNTATSGIITASSFAARVDFAAGVRPYSVAIGDLGGDGKPDLAVASEGSNTVSIYQNTATSGSITTASFAAKIDFITDFAPVSVAIGDLDGDGKLDLAVANLNSISIFRNTANSGIINSSSFAARVGFVTEFGARAVAIGDLDGDSKPDLAVANFRSSSVSVFRNTATSGSITTDSFAAKVNFSTGINPTRVAIGDLDGDGKPDLAVSIFESSTVSVYRNTSISGNIGSSSFATKVDFATGVNPQSVAIGDLDGDGKPDLAVANFSSGTVSVLRNASIEPVPATHLHFDGTNDNVTLPASIGNSLSNGTEMTIEYWFKGTNLQSGVRFQDGAGYIVAGWGAGAPSFIVSTDGGTSGVSCGSPAIINNDAWHHLAFVWKKNTTFATYLDGVLQYTRAADNVNLPTFSGVMGNIGSFNGLSEFLTGNLDDVRIWNVALSANDIARRRNCELAGNEAGLLAYYKFNQGFHASPNTEVNSLTDATANAYNGSLSGFAYAEETSNWLAASPVASGVTIPVAPTADAQAFCGTPTVANLVPAPSATLNWYNVATGGTALASSAAIAAGTYYAAAVNANGCESTRTTVAVTVKTAPTAPTSTNISVCQNATTATITAATTQMITAQEIVYFNVTAQPVETNSPPGTIVASANYTLPAGAIITGGTLTYNNLAPEVNGWIAISLQSDVRLGLTGVVGSAATGGTTGAGNSSGAFNYTRAIPATAFTANNGIVNLLYWDYYDDVPGADCIFPLGVQAASLTINYTMPLPVKWYDAATAGTLLNTGATLETVGTSVLPNTATTGTYTFYAAVVNANGCESARTAVAITVNPTPTAPTTANINLCQNTTSAVITATAPQAITAQEIVYFNVTAQPIERNSAPGNLVASANYTLPAGAIITGGILTYNNVQPSAGSLQDDVFLGLNGVVVSDADLGTGALDNDNPFNYSRSIPANAFTANNGIVNLLYWEYHNHYQNDPDCTFPLGAQAASLTINYTIPVTIKWYDAATAGTLLNTGATLETVGTSVLPNTATAGTYTFYAAAVYANGCESARTAVTVTVNPAPTVTDQSFCETATVANLVPAPSTTMKWYNVAIGGSELASTTALTTGNYYATAINANGCESARTAVVVTVNTTTWNGTEWSNGVPSISKGAVFTGDYAVASDLIACNLKVLGTAVVSVPSGFNLTISGKVTVAATASLTFENNANLIQVDGISNSGNITLKRNTNVLKRLDYTMWSSPVTGNQTLLQFSPLTSASPVRFYTYNSTNNVYSTATVGSTFATATGYLIRMPNEKPGSLGTTTPYYLGTESLIYTGTFTGVPNNGTIALNNLTANKYYAVGNPYPSTIDADAFLAGNATDGTLYFWRKTNGADGTAYASYTLAGGVSNSGGLSSIIPNGKIQVGQGFIAKATSTSFVFSNALRMANNSNQFLKTKAVEKHRIWLNLAKDNIPVNQMMVAYLNGATVGIDPGLDGKFFNDSTISLNSIINNEEFVIQAKGLPFEDTDVIPLTFKTNADGYYTISIDHVDGLFSGNQDIYLQDNLIGFSHNLKDNVYEFTSGIGTFTSRFELVYKNTSTLGIEDSEFSNAVVVFKQNGVLNINSEKTNIKNVSVFDIQGRLIFKQDNINQNTTILNGFTAAAQTVLVQITSDDDKVVTKKVMY